MWLLNKIECTDNIKYGQCKLFPIIVIFFQAFFIRKWVLLIFKLLWLDTNILTKDSEAGRANLSVYIEFLIYAQGLSCQEPAVVPDPARPISKK